MRHATPIGRLGALAVALGIGTAVASLTPGVAAADPADSSATTGPAPRAHNPTTNNPTTKRGTARPRVDRSPASTAAAVPARKSERPRTPTMPTAEPTAAQSAPVRAATSLIADTPPAQAPVTIQSAPHPDATAAPSPVGPAGSPRSAMARSMRAAVAAPSQTVSALYSAGGVSPGNAPTQAPLLWTVIAWARREFRGTVSQTAPVAALITTSQVTSPNLLVNPGAEVGDPSLSGFSSVTVPGWAVTGTPTVIKYGTPRNFWPVGISFKMPDLPSFMSFPKAKSGPADGGAQFFGGGDVATGTLTQIVDLRGAAVDIDTGTVTYNLSGWLGGYLLDPSAASVEVSFLDSNKTYLGSATIGPVGPLERWLQTGFKERETSGALPEGTRYARVSLTLDDRNPLVLGFAADYNSAFADNISFTVGADLQAPPPPDRPPSAVSQLPLDHVFMVYLENKGYDDIVGSPNAPFLNSLINGYGSATAYHGLTHPSLPNYYPIVGGTDFGLTYNCATPCIDAGTTLVSNIDAAGKTWRGYAQSMPYPGALVDSGDYSTEQLPFLAFKAIADDPVYAAEHLFPLEQMAIDLESADTAPDYAWFAANEDFNGEGPVDFPWGALRFAINQLEIGNPYNITALDQFLSETVPVILNSHVWNDPAEKSVLIVTFDEDNNNTSLGFGNQQNRVVTVVIPSPGAVAAGMRSGPFLATDYYNHYSLLRTIEDALELPPLTNNDKYATPLNEFWTADGTQV